MKTKNIITIVAGTALILAVPLIAMQFTDEVDWDLRDFSIVGVLLLGAGFAYELMATKMENARYRTIVGLALAAVVLLIWGDLAVGIFNIPGISGS